MTSTACKIQYPHTAADPTLTQARAKLKNHAQLALLFAAVAWPGIGRATPETASYNEAVAQVSHQKISLNSSVVASVDKVKARYPGTILAACAPTGSMRPTLDENHIVALEDCAFSSLHRGDIILIRLGASAKYAAVMHRIVDNAGMGNLQTQGDALENPDQLYTTSSNYLGKRVVAAIALQSGAISWLLDGNAPPKPSRIARKKS